jgi:hypothetical protein
LNTLPCSSKLNPDEIRTTKISLGRRGKRRLVQTAWRRYHVQTYVAARYVFFLAEGETNFLFNPFYKDLSK